MSDLGYVYVISNQNHRVLKIGRSVDVTQRLADLQRLTPSPLTVLWTTPGGSELEAALHTWFAQYRVTNEWFDFSSVPDPIAVIANTVAVLSPTLTGRNRAMPVSHRRAMRPIVTALLGALAEKAAKATAAQLDLDEALMDAFDQYATLSQMGIALGIPRQTVRWRIRAARKTTGRTERNQEEVS